MLTTAKAISPSGRKYHPRSYAYYRCIGADAYRFGGVRLCWNKQLRTDLADEAVWEEVCRLLEHPERLEQEYRRRLVQEEKTPDELECLEARMGRLRQGIARLIDSYAEGLIDKGEFEPRITRMRERLKQIEEQAQQIKDEASLERELMLILGRLDEFASRVKEDCTQPIGPPAGRSSEPSSSVLRSTKNRYEWSSGSPLLLHTPRLPQKKMPKVCNIVGGVAIPPWGVPSSLGTSVLSIMMPLLRKRRMSVRILVSAIAVPPRPRGVRAGFCRTILQLTTLFKNPDETDTNRDRGY